MISTTRAMSRPSMTKKRMNTLIKRPVQSYCPYMGTKKLRSHIPKAYARQRYEMASSAFRITRFNPRVYHHTGNQIMLPAISPNRSCATEPVRDLMGSSIARNQVVVAWLRGYVGFSDKPKILYHLLINRMK